MKYSIISVYLRIRNTPNGKYSKLNYCLESADMHDLAVTCNLNYVINNFRDIYLRTDSKILRVDTQKKTRKEKNKGRNHACAEYPGSRKKNP